jgi:hypothetical protein
MPDIDEPGLGEPGIGAPGAGTSTLEQVEVTPEYAYDEGDHERFAHFVEKDKILASALSGEPVVALCGKVWVPNRDPQRFPVCPTCKEIYESLPSGGEGGDDSAP